MAKVTLKRLEDWPGYAVSVDGRIWSCKDYWGGFTYPWKPLKTRPDPYGYARVNLYVKGKMFTRVVHNIIWKAFHGPVPEGYEINHKDCDKMNPALGNLELMTHQGNMKQAWKDGLMDCHYGHEHYGVK